MTEQPEPPVDTSETEERAEVEQDARRPASDREIPITVFDAIRSRTPNPVQPVQLKPNDQFNFRCHRGVSCWNKCCHGADITLTPYDILRLSRHLGIRPREVVERYTVPAVHDMANMPVAKLKMGGEDGQGACAFVAAEGCRVYGDRPAACRYYPLGLISMKTKESSDTQDFHFLVKETHCRGHDETKKQTVDEFRREQGVEPYEEINRGWVDILMKLASWRASGDSVGPTPAPQTKRMFYMVSTDIDAFRDFVFKTRFLDVYDIDPALVEQLKTNDELLLRLGFDWLKNVMFNEPTVALKDVVLQQAVARARSEMGGS